MPLKIRAHDGCFIIRKLCNESLLTISFVHSLTLLVANDAFLELIRRSLSLSLFLFFFITDNAQMLFVTEERHKMKVIRLATFPAAEWLLFKSNVLNISFENLSQYDMTPTDHRHLHHFVERTTITIIIIPMTLVFCGLREDLGGSKWANGACSTYFTFCDLTSFFFRLRWKNSIALHILRFLRLWTFFINIFCKFGFGQLKNSRKSVWYSFNGQPMNENSRSTKYWLAANFGEKYSENWIYERDQKIIARGEEMCTKQTNTSAKTLDPCVHSMKEHTECQKITFLSFFSIFSFLVALFLSLRERKIIFFSLFSSLSDFHFTFNFNSVSLIPFRRPLSLCSWGEWVSFYYFENINHHFCACDVFRVCFIITIVMPECIRMSVHELDDIGNFTLLCLLGVKLFVSTTWFLVFRYIWISVGFFSVFFFLCIPDIQKTSSKKYARNKFP